MNLIKDVDGDELAYWPVSGMVEGDTVGPESIYIDCPVEGTLSAGVDSRLEVRGRIAGVGSYVDLSSSPIDLSSLGPGTVEFEIELEALSPIVGLERVPVFLGTSSSGPADWSA